MARIIRELAMEQNPDKKFTFPDIEFTGTQSGYTDDDDDEMDDIDYNKDLRPVNRLPPVTSAIIASTSATGIPKIPPTLNDHTIRARDNDDDDMEDEFDGADSDDLENVIPQKQIRAAITAPNKGKN